MNVLLEQHGNDYWEDAKQTKSKKKAIDILSYVAQFFKVFLK
jgi:hypothetical protein